MAMIHYLELFFCELKCHQYVSDIVLSIIASSLYYDNNKYSIHGYCYYYSDT